MDDIESELESAEENIELKIKENEIIQIKEECDERIKEALEAHGI